MGVVEKPPVPLQTQLLKVWAYVQNADGTFSPAPTSSGGSTGNVNITGINGSAPALTNPLPVELSDGTNPFGTSSNPLNVTLHAETTKVIGTVNQGTSPWVVSGAVTSTDASSGPTGSAVPADASYAGLNVAGTLRGATGVNPSGSIYAEQVDLASILGVTIVAAAAGVQKVGISGAAGATLDGTAGTPSAGVLTVQGVAGGTTLPVTATIAAAQSIAVTNAGTFAVQDQSGGATAATAPTKAEEQGLIAATSLPTAVTNGQLVGGMGDKFGRAISTLNGPRDIIGTASVQNTGASGTLIGQIGSTYCDIIQLILTNETATATVVSISDGTTTYKFALAANGGGVFTFPTPLPAASVNTNWTVSNSASSTVDCVALYVKNK